ncbi:nucleotidyltransferase domain-containing protein [uncultured Selenomonas sp.]|uniref:nucleotidyltransferase family protein n=1 Tax=uncultured Selenomonas sp. TaxID=159275 RepID=UPI0028ECC94B|nr:nucleotidyltransferase domain-containing protein [uncultured Selenomonas sp.]
MKSDRDIVWTAREMRILDALQELASSYGAERVVLFGSRARRTHGEKSDIDLAVFGCARFRDFSFAVDEEIDTLLSFDLVDMDGIVSTALAAEVERDGVILYEAVR